MTKGRADITPEDTREKLLAAALQHFAERGFYGASIAQIAGEVGLTKQALLYHFKRKEDLYGEVIRRIAERLRAQVDENSPPEQRFEDIVLGFYRASLDHPLESKMLLRELIDDQRRDAPENEFYFRKAFNRLTSLFDEIESLADLSFAERIARVYLALSAVQYFVSSGSILRRYYGEEEAANVHEAYPLELRKLARQLTRP